MKILRDLKYLAILRQKLSYKNVFIDLSNVELDLFQR